MLPIQEASTAHIDTFWVNVRNKINVTTGKTCNGVYQIELQQLDGQLGAMRTIVRYWRDKGVDVTSEGLPAGLDTIATVKIPTSWCAGSI